MIQKIKLLWNSVYFNNRLYLAGFIIFICAIISYYIPFLNTLATISLFVLTIILLIDFFILFKPKIPIEIKRICPDKLSNGDDNTIQLYLTNYFSFPVYFQVVDEIPHVFQKRDILFEVKAEAGDTKIINYILRPTKRGAYEFGNTLVYCSSPLGFVQRKITVLNTKEAAVYPSIIQMYKYEFLAISNRLTLYGLKKIRKIGHNTEFEKIKEYVAGDDIRTINWKATAKRSSLMVNQYIDERAQPVYCVIDMGRNMRMPFHGLSLLDYSINSALVLSNIALKKFDKAGIITFSHKIDSFLAADSKSDQINKVLELLYKQQTGFLESNFEALYIQTRRQIKQRSLILLYTNFESLSSMERQLPYLRAISQKHLLCVVFFVNTELRKFIEKNGDNLESVYEKTIAEKLDFEKRQIVKVLSSYGIYSILTEPENLTVNAINKYLSFKAKGLI